MKMDAKNICHSSRAYRVDKGAKFRLKNYPPEDTGTGKTSQHADDLLAASLDFINDLQEKLYAQNRFSILLIFQAIDAAGKDGTIKHVMSGINPQGCRATSFKVPSTLEFDHDFFWRSTLALPERGQIGIFNRSYYEEVLVTRVHPELLDNEKLPSTAKAKHFWKDRYQDINAYERHLTRSGTVIRKFFLNISKSEQKKRFLARLDHPAKNWKFSEADLKEREHWDDYQIAYEKMIQATATPEAPWYVVPANDKKFAHLVVAGALIETLHSLKPAFPSMTAEQRKMLAKARKILS